MTAPVRARLEWTRRPGTGPPPGILGDLAGQVVIELGCGSGHNLAVLAARYGALVTGVDHDSAKIFRACLRSLCASDYRDAVVILSRR